MNWISVTWRIKDQSYPQIRMFYSDIHLNYKEAAEKLVLQKNNDPNVIEVSVKSGTGFSSGTQYNKVYLAEFD